jgi:gephyrin
MVEDTELVERTENEEEKTVRITVSAQPGENIREIGSDVAVGEVILPKGSRITAAGGEVGLLASVGVTEVSIWYNIALSETYLC